MRKKFPLQLKMWTLTLRNCQLSQDFLKQKWERQVHCLPARECFPDIFPGSAAEHSPHS